MAAGLLLFACSVPLAVYYHMLKSRIFTYGKLSSEFLGGIRQAVLDAPQNETGFSKAVDAAHEQLLGEAQQIRDDFSLIVLLLGELAVVGLGIAYLSFKLQQFVQAQPTTEVGSTEPKPDGVLPKS
jgi:hypothetical protein